MKNKMKAWRRANAAATAKGFDRNDPEHREQFTTKREVAAGSRWRFEQQIPSPLLVAVMRRVGLIAPL